MTPLQTIAGAILTTAIAAPNASAQWSSQQEARIYPQPNDLAYGDSFGGACDLSGTTLLVGAGWHDPFGNGDDFGAAYVFVRSGSTWIQEQKLASSAYDGGDRLGLAVALLGDTAVVGAPHDEIAGPPASGAVYVYSRQAGVWTEEARLVAGDASTFAHFGSAVAIDGDSIAVGAEFDDAGSGSYGGSAYVFVRNGNLWTEQAKLTATGGGAYDYMGRAIAIQGDRVVVGAPEHDQNGLAGSGSIYVFERSGTAWFLVAELSPADAAAWDEFGAAVALDGGTILVGAPSKTGIGWEDGAAYVFVGGGASWVQEAKLSDMGAAYHDQFGRSVDLEGDRAVVGLPWSFVPGVATGAVQLFARSSGAWTGEMEMIGSDCEGGDYLGSSVAISGELVASGAEYGETPPGNLGTGEAYVFEIVPPPFIVSYCTAKTNSQGCVPAMSWSGVPSASNPNAFTLACTNALNFMPGLLIYGMGSAALPFQGGTLCVGPSVLRTTLQTSLGNPPPPTDCSGTYAYDMNARIQSGVDPNLVAGAMVFAQYWSRDPADPFASSLSDAVQFEIAP